MRSIAKPQSALAAKQCQKTYAVHIKHYAGPKQAHCNAHNVQFAAAPVVHICDLHMYLPVRYHTICVWIGDIDAVNISMFCI